ncbi:MAG: hypothetical protein M3530_06010 [Thermoproteota archaeon]|nr:hypothetical protein [Thermoproteota archaeon]
MAFREFSKLNNTTTHTGPDYFAATMLLSTERSSIFINPHAYPRDTREFRMFFHTPFDTPASVSLPDCLVGTVLWRRVHQPLKRRYGRPLILLLSSGLSGLV